MLVRGFVCWRYKVPPGCYPRHTRRIRRCYAGIFCMMIISFRSAYGSSFYNYKIQNRISCRYKKRQKKKTRTESARIQNQKCGLSKEFRCCRRTDRSCRDRARGSLHSPGSSGLPASGMFLRSLDRVFRDTSDSLAGSHRSVIITPFSSTRGTTLAVMASSVSRILPGQDIQLSPLTGEKDCIAASSIDTPT